MPGGRTHASESRSYNQAAVRSPRLKLSAVWIGVRICSSTNTAPTSSSGCAIPPPSTLPLCCTAATTMPVAIAKITGSTPRSSSTIHQPSASHRSAFGSTLKNCHSFRPVSIRITGEVSQTSAVTSCKNVT